MGAIYYRQMVELGKTHKQAMGVVMSHLASRVYTVLKEDRPYQLRDLEGNPVTMVAGRSLVRERFQVPEEVCRPAPAEVHNGFGPFPLLQPHAAQLPTNPPVQPAQVSPAFRIAEVGHPPGEEGVPVTMIAGRSLVREGFRVPEEVRRLRRHYNRPESAHS